MKKGFLFLFLLFLNSAVGWAEEKKEAYPSSLAEWHDGNDALDDVAYNLDDFDLTGWKIKRRIKNEKSWMLIVKTICKNVKRQLKALALILRLMRPLWLEELQWGCRLWPEPFYRS